MFAGTDYSTFAAREERAITAQQLQRKALAAAPRFYAGLAVGNPARLTVARPGIPAGTFGTVTYISADRTVATFKADESGRVATVIPGQL